MKKALFYSVFFLFVNNIFAQNCIYVFEDSPFFCFTDPNRQSGDIIQMTYEDFNNENVINALVQDGGDFCDDRSVIKIIRRLKSESTSIASARNRTVDCREKLVFEGFSPCVSSASCNDSLILFVEIMGSPLDFDAPPNTTVPCDYDIKNDPNGLIGFPNNVKGGKISFSDNLIPNDCSNQITITRTWTATSCTSGTISKIQNITILPANCSYDGSIIFNIPNIPTGDYYSGGILLTNGSVFNSNNVKLFGKNGVTLQEGFHATANSNFTAAIGNCIIIPSNDDCSLPTQLSCGDFLVGSTNNSTTNSLINNGCPVGSLDAGIYFSILGNGSPIKISTNHIFTNFDTELRVYKGNCAANTCVIQNDDIEVGNTTSEVVFNTLLGEHYIIYLDGFNGAKGNFGISATCFSGDLIIPCNNAIFATTSSEENQFEFADYNTGSCSPISLFSGNDKSFLLNIVVTNDYTINMFELQADLDLFLVSLNDDFSFNQCMAESRLGDANDESFTLNLVPGKYAIIADGPNNMIESCFMLEVTCSAPLTPQSDDSQLTLDKNNKLSILKNQELIKENRYGLEEVLFNLSPNPTNGFSKLVYQLPKTMTPTISLLNINGQLIEKLQTGIQQSKGYYEIPLNLSSYPKGIYFINLQTSLSNNFQKIIVQ